MLVILLLNLVGGKKLNFNHFILFIYFCIGLDMWASLMRLTTNIISAPSNLQHFINSVSNISPNPPSSLPPSFLLFSPQKLWSLFAESWFCSFECSVFTERNLSSLIHMTSSFSTFPNFMNSRLLTVVLWDHLEKKREKNPLVARQHYNMIMWYR